MPPDPGPRPALAAGAAAVVLGPVMPGTGRAVVDVHAFGVTLDVSRVELNPLVDILGGRAGGLAGAVTHRHRLWWLSAAAHDPRWMRWRRRLDPRPLLRR